MRMRMRNLTLACVALIGIAACDDGVTSSIAFDEEGLIIDAALVAADGMFQDLALMNVPTSGPGLTAGNDTNGVEVEGSISFSRTRTFYDTLGVEQERYDPESTGSVHTLPGGCRPAATMSQNTIYSCLIQSVTLVGCRNPQYHFLFTHRLTLTQSPYLTITLRQDPVQQSPYFLYTTENSRPTGKHLHGSNRIQFLFAKYLYSAGEVNISRLAGYYSISWFEFSRLSGLANPCTC